MKKPEILFWVEGVKQDVVNYEDGITVNSKYFNYMTKKEKKEFDECIGKMFNLIRNGIIRSYNVKEKRNNE